MSMFDFTGKNVIVTGAAGALGQAVAAGFKQAGARLALVDINTDALAGRYGGDTALLLRADLTDPESIADAVERTLSQLGRIDVLANVAGGFKMGPRVHETAIEDWDFMLNLNAKSVFLMSRAVVPQMLAAGGGKIINVAARVAREGRARMAPYSVAKTAVARLTEALAAEYREDNINVNCVLPGTLDTPANRQAMPDADFSRWVAPAALADVIMFLACDAARAIHGASVPVYGMT